MSRISLGGAKINILHICEVQGISVQKYMEMKQKWWDLEENQ